MQIITLKDTGKNLLYRWPEGNEMFHRYIDYLGIGNGTHHIRLGFTRRYTYDKERTAVVVWIDDTPYATFIGADDFYNTGELLSQIKISKDNEYTVCKYPADIVPERYSMFNTVGMPLRIHAKNVSKVWAVSANIADHRTMIELAALRKNEVIRQKVETEEKQEALA